MYVFITEIELFIQRTAYVPFVGWLVINLDVKTLAECLLSLNTWIYGFQWVYLLSLFLFLPRKHLDNISACCIHIKMRLLKFQIYHFCSWFILLDLNTFLFHSPLSSRVVCKLFQEIACQLYFFFFCNLWGRCVKFEFFELLLHISLRFFRLLIIQFLFGKEIIILPFLTQLFLKAVHISITTLLLILLC